jgi:hypothetical protein
MDEAQARLLTEALDFYSRIGIGQLEELVNSFRWLCDPRLKDKHHELEVARRMIDSIKLLLFNMPANASYGIYHQEVPECYRAAWDIQKVIKHQLWLDRQAEEGEDSISRYCVDADEPRQSAKDQPLATIRKVEDNGS